MGLISCASHFDCVLLADSKMVKFKVHRLAVTDSENVVKDRLTSLPDSLILHILSFLPTHDAVRTILISKSFSSIWTLLPSVDLDWWGYRYQEGNCNDYHSRFFEYMRYVLKHHKRPKIDKLRVRIDNKFIGMNLGNDLKSCIDFALRKQVKTLDFSFCVIGPHSMLFKWPSELISDSLVELTLTFVHLNSLTQVHLGSLRLMVLIEVDVSNSVLGEIICGCPLLKELEVHNCPYLNELSFVAPNVEKLKVDIFGLPLLEDSDEYEDDYDEHFVKINCPNLKSLEFTGRGYCVEIVNLSSIIDVTFDLDCEYLNSTEISKIARALKMLLCAKKVSFSDEFVTISFFYMLKQASHIPAINWKSANFSCWLTKKYIHGLDFMLRNSPHLEELVIDFITRHEDISELIKEQFEDDMLDKEDCWMRLQSVIFHNVTNTSYPVLVSLTELLLKKAPELNHLMFNFQHRIIQLSECSWTIEKMTKFEKKTSKLTKAFPNVKISYLR